MITSTLLFDGLDSGVKARLWSAAFAPAGVEPPPDALASIGYPGVWDERFSGPEGTIGFQTVPAGQTRVWFTKDGYMPQSFDTTMPDDGAKTITLVSGALGNSPSERVELDGYVARTADTHTPFFFKGESAFLDLFRLLRGEDLTSLLQQSQTLGSNGRRAFFCSWNTAKQATGEAFDPRRYGRDFFDAIPVLLDQYAARGLWLYASVFPDNGYWPEWTLTQKIDHWLRTCSALKQRPNSFAVELTNEPNGHAENDVDARQFTQPFGILSCSGSRGDTGSDPMPDPQWSFCDHHNERSYPKCVTDLCTANHPSRQFRQKAMLEGEPLGFGNPALNPNRSADPRIAREMAGTAHGTNIGVIFHSQHGGFSQLYDEIELSCARAWFAELR